MAPSLAPSLAQAQSLLAAGRIQDALRLLEPAVERPAQQAEALYLLAVAAVMAKEPGLALSRAREAVTAKPFDARCHFALGRALKLGGRVAEAESAYRRAIELDPAHAEAHVSLGIVLKHRGDLEAAIESYRRALALRPGLAAARANLAYAQGALAEREAEAGAHEEPSAEVIEGAQRAADMDPGNDTLQFNLGLLLRKAVRRRESVEAFNRALGLEPADARYCLHLGQALSASGHFDATAGLYRRWLEQYPADPAIMRHLADRLARDGLVSEALAWAERIVALEPDPSAYLLLSNTYQQCRRLEDSLAAGRKAIELSAGRWQTHAIPAMVSNYLLEEPQGIADIHAALGRALAEALPADWVRPERRARRPDERLHLAFLSADFVNHSVAFFMGPILAGYDRSRFEVTCYFNRGFGDDMTERFKSQVDHWVECEHLSDDALARHIRDSQVDVLVDLMGHTAGSRVAMIGRGPAPLQISYLGYPTWTGAQTLDYRITDRTIDPGDMPDIGSERPLCLPRSMFCYRPPDSPPIGPPPQLEQGVLTFGSFNNHAKLSDHCLDLWAQVLMAVPESRLLLKSAAVADPANRDDITRFMAARGVGASRLDLRSRIPVRSSHFEAYNLVDVALDPFPYNGATTTCEALWMGVPVLSRAGATHTSRMGASILSAAGQARWVTWSDADYVRAAVALAQDLAGRAAWRLQARESLRASELLDEAGFLHAFQALLLQAANRTAP